MKVGDKVSQFDKICEVQSDKASVTITSRYDGIVKKLHHAVDDTALVGEPLVDIETEDGMRILMIFLNLILGLSETDAVGESKIEEKKTFKLPQQNTEQNEDYPICIPSVRRLAKENNVCNVTSVLELCLHYHFQIRLSDIKGTGKNGRILKEDVLKFIKKEPQSDEQRLEDVIKPLTPFQKAMFKTMTASMVLNLNCIN